MTLSNAKKELVNLLFSRRTARRKRRRTTSLACESLESRTLFAADVALIDGVLDIHGTDKSDQIFIDEVTHHETEIAIVDKKDVDTSSHRPLETARPEDLVRLTSSTQMIRVTMRDELGELVLVEDFEASAVDRIDVNAFGGDDHVANNTHKSSTLRGGTGADRLVGGHVHDEIYGADGADEIFGRGGDDEIWGDYAHSGSVGEGDLIHAGAGDDWVHGGGGDDLMFGGSGSDEMYGRGGHDEILGDGLDNIVSENVGLLTRAWDYIKDNPLFLEDDGDGAADIISGGAGSDVLHGQAGGDELDGGVGSDHIFGGDGSDLLDAGDDMAVDMLYGDDGFDQFYMGENDLFSATAGATLIPGLGWYSSKVVNPDSPYYGLRFATG